MTVTSIINHILKEEKESKTLKKSEIKDVKVISQRPHPNKNKWSKS